MFIQRGYIIVSFPHASRLFQGTRKWKQEHNDWVYTVSWSRTEGTNRIASAGRDGEVQIWDAFSGKNLVTYRGHRLRVNAVAWSPDDGCVVSASGDGTMRVHGATSDSEDHPRRHTPVRSIAWSPDGKLLASGGDDSLVRLWELGSDGSLRRVGNPYQNHRQRVGIGNASINAIAWAPPAWLSPEQSQEGRGFLASAGDDRTIHIWEAFTNREILRYDEHESSINALAWSPGGRYIASGGNGGSVRIWDTGTKTTVDSTRPAENAVLRNRMPGHRDMTFSQVQMHLGNITALAWSPDGTRLAVASYQCVYILGHKQGKIIHRFRYDGHDSWVRAVAWSPDGRHIVSGGDDKCAHVWLAEGNVRKDPKGF
jgi:eukaryotic-like serine/threonine-protein kinase